MTHHTSKTAKINFINSGPVDIIRSVYYIHGAELMKLIFAVLDVWCVINGGHYTML